MTKIASFIHGIYPRSEELAQVSRDFERKRKSASELKSKYSSDLKHLVSIQKKMSFDYIEDGKLHWADLFRPIIEASNGFTTGPLTRWYDNNSFYRQPIINNDVSITSAKLKSIFPLITPSSKWKVTLPSPFTFAKLTKNLKTDSFEITLLKITEILESVVKYLSKQGVALIQLNETYIPYLGISDSDFKLYLNSLKKLINQKGEAKIALFFYFGDADPIVSKLPENLNLDMVGIDFYKTNITSLPKKLPYDLIAGIIDGRNSLLENKETLQAFINKAVKTFQPKTLYLSNNSDLELLPEKVARKKLELLGKLLKN